MHITRLRRHLGAFLVALAAFTLSGAALADPPSRVARLADVTGAVSFAPGGDSDWIRAMSNRPLITGDRLWVDAGARGELQLGGVAIRMGPQTSMALLNVDDRMAQVRLSQGTLNIRVWRLARDEAVEIDTPNLALSIRRPGSYRVDVDANGESTAVTVRSGQAEVYGDGRAFAIGQGQGWRFFDSGLRDYDSFALAPPDDFDRWASARDRRSERSASARYVSRDMIGYEDLDEHGSWRDVAGYGHVWTPARVSADWAPYRDGHWAWVQPWGWTWVDDAPWGFAPSHYGRWANIGGSWGWIPGPATVRPVYAPALVAFVGATALNLNLGGGAVAWFALGPREVYRPTYQVSREYFNRVNTSNAVVNPAQVTSFYNNSNTATFTYANRQVAGAVVAVPAATFVQSRPVAREAVRVSREAAVAAPVAAAAPSAPARISAAGPAGPKPPETALKRPVFARSAPPPAAAPAATAQAPAPAPVTLVKPPESAPVAPPPKRADAGAPRRERPMQGPTPAAPAAAPVPAAPPAPAPAPAPAPRAAPAREREPAAVEAPRPATPPPAASAPRNEVRPRGEQERMPPRTPAARPEATRPETPRPEAARPAASPPPPPPVAPVAPAPAPAPAPRPQPQPERAVRAPAPVERPVEPPAARPAPPAPRPPASPQAHPTPAPAAVPPQPPTPVPAPAPAATPPEQRGRGPRNEPPKAAERREAASEAGKPDDQPGRGPEGRGRGDKR